MKDSTLLIDYLSNKKQQQKHSIYSPFSACMKKKAEESEPLTKENWKEEVFKKNISNELGIMIYVLNNFFYCFFFIYI